jgi:hypothetical protein
MAAIERPTDPEAGMTDVWESVQPSAKVGALASPRRAMTDYTVEVQPDFLERVSRARPIQAVAELVWNALDADATLVEVFLEYDDLGMSRILIRDNGDGIPFDKASELYRRLGGSWKKPGARTAAGRVLHGYEGRGRFRAFALGRVVDWKVTYRAANGKLRSYTITMVASDIQRVRISDERDSTAETTGIEVTVSELHREYRSLESDNAVQELAEVLALYLNDYRDVTVRFDGNKIDPAAFIASTETVGLDPIVEDDETHPVVLEIIEWRKDTRRALYLCTDAGFPLSQVEMRFHVGPFDFSAYLKSPFITKLHKNAELDFAEMNPLLLAATEEARQTIKSYFRARAAEKAKFVVEDWKNEKVYPYEGEAASTIEVAERQVFDIVAVTASEYLPDFDSGSKQNKAFSLHMIKGAIERGGEDLHFIFTEVLKLPVRKREELAQLLHEASLSNIISAAKLVADRLKFLTGLEAILFDEDKKPHLKERKQLHRILAKNTWVFGEEFHLTVDDRSLTEVLKKHSRAQNLTLKIDEPVLRVDGSVGIIDLMLSKAIPTCRTDELEHLIVELKAPSVKLGSAETTQIKSYAFAVADDERFKGVNTKWNFWLISNDLDKHADREVNTANSPRGMLFRGENPSITIWVKTWGQLIAENKARLRIFQEKFEWQVDQGAALKHIHEHYADFLKGVVGDEVEDPSPDVEPVEKVG